MNESTTAVLIYDGEYAYRSVATSALKRLDDVETIPWYGGATQAFLDAQFTDVPFAMVFVDRREDRVYAGYAAAKELTDRAGMPGLLGNLVRDNYNRIVKVVSIVNGCGRDPDDVHSVYDLEPDTADPFAPPLDNTGPRPARLSQSGRRTPTDG